MAFDYKKEYKEFYMPKKTPAIIKIPKMNYIAVRGKGNPNDEIGEYKKSIEILYAIAYTLKMSYKGDHKIDGFFQYVVPPLEGLWWQEGSGNSIDCNNKEDMKFISIIRMPDFVSEKDFKWALEEASLKKKQDFSKAEFLPYDEGICVQCMHIGSYDDEPETISLMNKFAAEAGYETDITDVRFHHEIYLSDPRRCDESRLKTVIRHPVKKINSED
ncbi:MAG: GyrI-like domain-containing protein [Anaerovoracaceae bacterium]